MKKIVITKALVFDEKDRLLLVRRSKTAPRRPLQWDFPGGFTDDQDESFQHACLRELKEEAGITTYDDLLNLAYTDTRANFGTQHADVSFLYFSGRAYSTDVRLSFEHD